MPLTKGGMDCGADNFQNVQNDMVPHIAMMFRAMSLCATGSLYLLLN